TDGMEGLQRPPGRRRQLRLVPVPAPVVELNKEPPGSAKDAENTTCHDDDVLNAHESSDLLVSIYFPAPTVPKRGDVARKVDSTAFMDAAAHTTHLFGRP